MAPESAASDPDMLSARTLMAVDDAALLDTRDGASVWGSRNPEAPTTSPRRSIRRLPSIIVLLICPGQQRHRQRHTIDRASSESSVVSRSRSFPAPSSSLGHTKQLRL